MGTCALTDKLMTAAAVGLDGQAVYAWPQDNTIRVDDGTAVFRPIEPDIAIRPAPYQYGTTTTSAGGGMWSLDIPMSTEQHPADALWFVRLPDGKTWQGVPPSAVGPFTIDDLVTSHGWTVASGQTVSVPAGFKGEVTLTAAEFIDFVFPDEFPSDKLDALVSLQDDQAGGGVPGVSWTNRSQAGIKLLFTSPYTGIMTYRFGATQ